MYIYIYANFQTQSFLSLENITFIYCTLFIKYWSSLLQHGLLSPSMTFTCLFKGKLLA